MSLVSVRKKGYLYKLPVKGIVKVSISSQYYVLITQDLMFSEMEQALVCAALHYHRRHRATGVL